MKMKLANSMHLELANSVIKSDEALSDVHAADAIEDVFTHFN